MVGVVGWPFFSLTFSFWKMLLCKNVQSFVEEINLLCQEFVTGKDERNFDLWKQNFS